MSDLALRVDHLGKSYRIAYAQHGQKVGRYKTLQEDLLALPRGLWSAVRGRNGAGHETVWALKDVSFEVKQGEVLGIIGRNGAGKSTLLKILSRITEPTEGRAEVYGRVGSLLEVGTGFHPELTGQENIFLNGAVLGMRRAEIARKFDEIVAFAEVEKFIDTPVKFYSSGMYVRLAFAVAAHLEPEILVVDEVLAVGDAEFQKKCLGKMGEIGASGRTVLFVSHNMAAIARLCQRCILLNEGHIVEQGDPRQVIDIYLSSDILAESEIAYPLDPTKVVQIRRIRLLDDSGRPSVELDQSRPFRVSVEVEARQYIPKAIFVFSLETIEGTRVCDSISGDQIPEEWSLNPGETYKATVQFPGNLLNSGSYRFRMQVASYRTLIDEQSPPSFRINDFGSSTGRVGLTYSGILYLPLKWDMQRLAVQDSMETQGTRDG